MAIKHRGTIGIPTDGFSALWSVLFWLAAFGAAGYGVYWCVGALKAKADSEVATNAPKASAVSRREGGAGTRKAPPNEGRQIKPELDRAAAEVNILTLSKEVARLKGDSVTQAEHARSAALARAKFQRLASGEFGVPEVLEGNDEILGLDDTELARMKPEAAAQFISNSIARIPAGTFLRVRVRRGIEKEVHLYFTAASGTGMVVVKSGYTHISNEFALEIQKQVLSLPPDQLTDYERKQIEKILSVSEATDEEYAMLVRKVTGAATDSGAAKASAEGFTRQIQRLEGFLPKAPVPEAILLKDGRRFAGKLLAETPAAVSVRTVVGDVTVPKDDVAAIITANDLRAEFASKFSAGQKYRDALLQLVVWTKEMNMPVHQELVAYTILQKTPNDPFARNAAGYVQMDGQWTLKNSIAAGAPIPEKKAETKDDIRRELESMGFVLRKDKWYSKVPWSAGLDSLYRPPSLPMKLTGTAVMDWHEADTPIYRKDEKPKKLGALDLKFVAPTAAQGLATIAVEAPGEILECQVKASGYVLEEAKSARIECFLTAEGGKSEVLYDITGKSDFNFHDVTLYVRGKQKFTVTARMQTVVDKYQTYARYLPSNKDTSQVFWVKGVVLKPASEFDRVWASAK